jgi:hypothetical protein
MKFEEFKIVIDRDSLTLTHIASGTVKSFGSAIPLDDTELVVLNNREMVWKSTQEFNTFYVNLTITDEGMAVDIVEDDEVLDSEYWFEDELTGEE